ncbi:unnamed protein product, partial [Didymodactylos carnosus]
MYKHVYIFDCEHCVLIGGIGITPYVSVLLSLMYQFRSQRIVCSNSSHMNCTNEFCHRRTLKKIEQETYLNANPEHEHYLDIHLYFTSLASNETSRIDMYTNLKTKTRIGRPNWKLLFSKLKVEQNNRGT